MNGEAGMVGWDANGGAGMMGRDANGGAGREWWDWWDATDGKQQLMETTDGKQHLGKMELIMMMLKYF